MRSKAFCGCLVLCVKVTLHNTWILALPLTILGIAGELVAFTIININNIDIGPKEGIDVRLLILLQAC